MKILVSGSTGVIGSALVPFLTRSGHTIVRLVRTHGDPSGIFWDPMTGSLDAAKLEGFDALVHLAGENIAAGRWTPTKKKRIRDSRVLGTKLLSDTLARLKQPPKTFVSASAIGVYGNRGDLVLDEGSDAGTDFLADVCWEWETATAPAAQKGIRVVNLRLGIVLSPRGGALAKMLFPFKLGLGGRLGSGRQYMSWISLDDALAAIELSLITVWLSGPVNVVAPKPITNAEFTKTLGRVLSRPTVLPVPRVAVRLLFGEMGYGLLLGSQRVEPGKLSEANFRFQYPDLEGALRHLLDK